MKPFHITDTYALINFDSINIQGRADLLNSNSFRQVFRQYIGKLKKEESYLINELKDIKADDVLTLFKLLLVYDLNQAIKQVDKIKENHIQPLYKLVESFYDYWREIARFGLLKGSKNYDPSIKINDLMNTSHEFNQLILSIYRTISQKLYGKNFHVFRQLPAGINANMLYIRHKFTNHTNYSKIQNIPFVTKMVISPPFIINSQSNTRTGLFEPIEYNPLEKININKAHFIAFPILVGPLLAFVYIHRDYIHQGIALSNLFEFANYQDYLNRNPDLIYIYGIDDHNYDCKYYHDTDENLYIGFVSRQSKNDYFGYLKKMLLTLHNVYMINKGRLPIHGAMVKLTLTNNITKNIAIIGDSGAGKSESLEALRIIGGKKIKNMEVIFDDMGVFKLHKNNISANGTETGAFIRLDDLDDGYAIQIMDRALFLNPKQKNARVVVPISTYPFITQDHNIDYLFYANNYEEPQEVLQVFNYIDDAIPIFKAGMRKAKGTTSEVGIVSSYFANPFGPVQMQKETDLLIDKYFEILYKNKIIVGQIYTKLAIDGFESKGPQEAAEALLKFIEKN